MRRFAALGAALVLVALLPAAGAAGSPPRGTGFIGDFEVIYQGNPAGHTRIALWPTVSGQPTSGTYHSSWADTSSVAIVTDVVFYAHDTYNEAWFNGLEIGTNGWKAAFTGQIVDYFDRATPDTIETWVRPMNNPITSPGGFDFTNSWDFLFTVGKGVFVLNVR